MMLTEKKKYNLEGERWRRLRAMLRVELNRFKRQGFSRRGRPCFNSSVRIGSDATFNEILRLLDLLGRSDEKAALVAHKTQHGHLYVSKPLPKIAA